MDGALVISGTREERGSALLECEGCGKWVRHTFARTERILVKSEAGKDDFALNEIYVCSCGQERVWGRISERGKP